MIYNNIIETIGNTPLVRINKINKGQAQVFAKLESFNPLSSVKDRVGAAMIDDAEKKGHIKSGVTTIIEPTSGNTGIALAFVCAVKGYKLILTMPETMSLERIQLLKILGAELVLTKGELGMTGAIDEANKLHKKIENSFIPGQFINPANPEIHIKTTAPEIWEDTNGEIDVLVAGVGTGGTITGVGQFLKSKNANIKIVAVEPSDSPVLSGGQAGLHKIQGIGAGFVPEILDVNIIDQIIKVDHNDAGLVSRELAKSEGILTGISGGAAMFAALELSKLKEFENKKIVVILPDTGERYLSTWLFT